ncbi:DNA recombination protein RmuC [Dethiosulfatibacter aminovorans DSM 17477]|uniref:DNA recombination protein RmuC n=1 Tax=Dethiosulfatibacter aminovorans DSM 17477 TaxID=1121476 RepID=A0A1M6FVQ7_9FIRM|nr:DNA recombination protein RmuC [Dethiosulfatibacter aminovorans]SHJ01774.1 DNA recombination protein RmuC [Dethiosulfatibacter aminovorans DSM 17477]
MSLGIEWITLYVMLGILIILSLINMTRISSMKRNRNDEKMMSDIKIIQMENNGKIFEKLQRNSVEMTESFLRFQNNVSKNVNESNHRLTESLNSNFNALSSRIEGNLDRIGSKVDERLSEGFEKTNKTFNSVIERLSKIDEAQKKIDSLSTNIVSLQDVLTDKKSRGTFGEVQLNNILKSVFGEKNEKVFQIQRTLSNSAIADAVLHLPEPVGSICIDSKFPLENYRRMTDKSLSEIERARAGKEFKTNVKKHIGDIGDKYIIDGETANQAIMFIPAEAIFAEINAYHDDLIEYARERRVWITSPTTLMSVLSTVQVVLKNIERDRYTGIIHQELKKLSEEFTRYKKRWTSLSQSIDRVTKDVRDINITSDKIEKRFSQISNVEIETGDVDLPGLEINVKN